MGIKKNNKIIKIRRDQEREVELREKSQWIRGILLLVGVPGVEDWAENLTMDDLRRIKVELKTLGIDIIDDSDNGIDIYWESNLIAEWKRPNYVLKSDPNEKDAKYRFFLEMHLNVRDVFEKNSQQE